MNKEVRMMAGTPSVVDGEHKKIEGCAIRFEQRSQLLRYGETSFYEVVSRGAIDEQTLAQCDIKAYMQHDPNRLLGRSYKGSGTLDLELREDGLYFSLELPNTPTGQEAFELVKRGDIRGCSFAFWDVESEWSALEDGTALRTITRMPNLDDVSIVVNPAYECTEVSVRGLDLMTQEEEQPEQEEEEGVSDLYFDELEAMI